MNDKPIHTSLGPRFLPGDVDDAPDHWAISAMLRVDHAGEAGAVAIYSAQQEMTKDDDAQFAHQLEHMAQEERAHFQAFCQLVGEYGARPSILLGIWLAGAKMMGTLTAMMGNETVHLCTVAVEDTIEQHYQQQIDALTARGGFESLVSAFTQFRDEEIAHRDEGLRQNAYESPFASQVYRAIARISSLAIATATRF